MWERTAQRIAKTILRRKGKLGEVTLLDLSPTNVAIIHTVWYWWRDRYIDQWKRMENLETDPFKCAQLIFNKGAKAIQWRKNSLSTKDVGAISHPQAMGS